MKDKSARRAGDNFIDASTSNLFLDREGDENAYEPKYLRKIADYYKSMGLISERKLPMPRKLYGGIEAAIGGAALQGADNEYTDFYRGFEKTDAAIVVEDALNKLFADLSMAVTVQAISIDAHNFKNNKPRLQDNENPDRFVVGAQAGLDDNGDGIIYLMITTAAEEFDRSLMNVASVAKEAANIIRHELMHDRQYSSLARDAGISRKEAKEKFIRLGLIPDDDAPRSDYLSSHIEIDAFGHEFAERLAQEFGLDEAEALVAGASSEKLKKLASRMDSSMGDNFREYYAEHPDRKFTKKLQKKIRKYLRGFRDQNLYEARNNQCLQITIGEIRGLVRDLLLSEALNKSDKTEIEKIARKQAKKEISKVVGASLEKTIRTEVQKALKDRATKEELSKITKTVMKKLYKDLAISYPQVIDRIKV